LDALFVTFEFFPVLFQFILPDIAEIFKEEKDEEMISDGCEVYHAAKGVASVPGRGVYFVVIDFIHRPSSVNTAVSAGEAGDSIKPGA
jgi:hypothetical protein